MPLYFVGSLVVAVGACGVPGLELSLAKGPVHSEGMVLVMGQGHRRERLVQQIRMRRVWICVHPCRLLARILRPMAPWRTVEAKAGHDKGGVLGLGSP